ncbi:MAG: YggT family protein [Eubacteriaceae bacterium]
MISSILIFAGYILFELMTIIFIVNALLSWVNPNPSNPIIKLLHDLTEPILKPIRRFAVIGAVDLSPIVAILLLQFVVFPLYKTLITFIF